VPPRRSPRLCATATRDCGSRRCACCGVIRDYLQAHLALARVGEQPPSSTPTSLPVRTNRHRGIWLVLRWDAAVPAAGDVWRVWAVSGARGLGSRGVARYGWAVKPCSQGREPCPLSGRWSMSPVVPVRRRLCRGSTQAEHRATKDNATPPIRRASMRSSRARQARYGARLNGLIVVLWRAGLRIHEALSLIESDLDPRRGSILIKHSYAEFGITRLVPTSAQPPAEACPRGRAAARRDPAADDPAPARPLTPLDDRHLPAGNLLRRDHLNRPRTTGTDDARQRRPRPVALGGSAPSAPAHYGGPVRTTRPAQSTPILQTACPRQQQKRHLTRPARPPEQRYVSRLSLVRCLAERR
jgi:hypothetical protein